MNKSPVVGMNKQPAIEKRAWRAPVLKVYGAVRELIGGTSVSPIADLNRNAMDMAG
ncbi:MAG: hypothetical protein ACLP66_03685 [Polyangia bacterium]